MEEQNKVIVTPNLCKCGHIINKHLYGDGHCVMKDCPCGKFDPVEEKHDV